METLTASDLEARSQSVPLMAADGLTDRDYLALVVLALHAQGLALKTAALLVAGRQTTLLDKIRRESPLLKILLELLHPGAVVVTTPDN